MNILVKVVTKLQGDEKQLEWNCFAVLGNEKNRKK